MAKLIESETVERDYGTSGTNAILEQPNGDRYLICDGFGGIDTLEGGCVRWKHGTAYRLQSGDTLESLRSTEWNEHVSLFDAVINGYDESRPVTEIDPTDFAIAVKLIERTAV